MDNQEDQPTPDNNKEQIAALTTERITQDQIVSGAIKPRHLMTSATSTAGAVPVSDGTNFSPSKSAFLYPFISGGIYKPIFGSNLPIGDNDLYTVPQGKKFLLLGIANSFGNAYNSSAGSITYYAEIKVSGTYYRIKSSVTLTTLTSSTSSFLTVSILLNAGETVAVNTATTAGLNIWAAGIEMDANNSTVNGGRILNLVSGYNTLYTVPTGKSAMLTGTIIGAALSGYGSVGIGNSSGGNLNYYTNYVPNGSSASSDNRLDATTTLGNNVVNPYTLGGALSSGDSIVVNSSGGGSGQRAWTTVFEI